MTVYPIAIDDDQTIIRIDDNLSELGTDVINQLRSAVFAIEKELGIKPAGSLTSLADRMSVSINPNGTIKASALTSVGLATLPIDNAQVGSSAGILESKLTLDYGTADLNAQVQSNLGIINTLASFTATINSDLLAHISGSVLASGDDSKHVASLIDLNTVPSDPRDPFYAWSGLLDKDGVQRSATHVAEALRQINDEFVDHQNDSTGTAHTATGISVDTTGFLVLPQTADTVQKAIDAIDNADALVIQQHQENLHSSGIPRQSRAVLINDVDGYSFNIIPPTPAQALLVNPPATTPQDDNSSGDFVISFNPTNVGFEFDAKFAQVQIGDVVRINYGNGIESIVNVESKRHVPGLTWVIRLNAINLANADGYSALVRIDKSRFNTNKYGTVAIAPANYINTGEPEDIKGSIIVGSPRGAQTLGIGFNPNQLDSSHFNLYLAMYPNGNPGDEILQLPAIDVTGDSGTSPGSYTIHSVVEATNAAFRTAGYNYRFIAFEYNGEFGIMLADAIGNAAFSIVNGVLSAGTLIEGAYSNNVIGDATDGKDALGLGSNRAGVASPEYTSSYSSAVGAATNPTRIFYPLSEKNFVVNGISRDTLASGYLTNNGYWDGYISSRIDTGNTIRTTYQVNLDLRAAELKPGKTIVVQPAIDSSNPNYSQVDYGRFIIRDINFTDCSCDQEVYTSITVANAIHGTSSAVGTSGVTNLPIRLYFSEDSVSINDLHVTGHIQGASEYVRYHEVYVSDSGKTFTHERVRVPEQSQTTTLLDVNNNNNFKITNVSNKLRGYLDASSSTFDRYVRFYVLNYDSVTGEYDGYLGRPGSSYNISDTGRIVKARKNIPTRFYDYSDVDFIEILYTEQISYPGTSILTTASPRYVDIEIFPTLTTNDEFLKLGSFNHITSSNIIDTVRDFREFGNVSEIDFTDSAIKFIEAGERYLHKNGIINGFTFIEEDASLPGTLIFNGGIALVNGSFSTLSSRSITIPEIVRWSGSETATLDWVICVNDQSGLEALPLTFTKEQFFVRIPSASVDYYIDSTSLDEIYNERNDLTPISIVNVTISSITINSVTDARRFSDTNAIPTVSTVDGYNTTFRTSDALINWIKWSHLTEVEIFYMEIDSPLTIINNNKITLKNGRVLVNGSSGFIINKMVTLDNIDFVYNYTVPSDPLDLSHWDEDAACLWLYNSIGDIDIKRCSFSQTATGDRPPYVKHSFDDVASPEIQNVNIEYNKFNESSNTYNAAIVFSTEIDESEYLSSHTRSFRNINIYKNEIDGYQSVLFGGGPAISFFSVGAIGVSICSNYMPNGLIGYNLGTPIWQGSDLSILKNTCYKIGSVKVDGINSGSTVGFLHTTISKNYCAVIDASNQSNIECNYLTPRPEPTWWYSSGNFGIIFNTGTANNNKITNYSVNSPYIYDRAIQCSSGGIVSDNTITAHTFTEYGIYVFGNSIVTNNVVERSSAEDVTYFIFTAGSGHKQIVTDNRLSHRYTDVAETNWVTIFEDPDNTVVTQRNINQLKVKSLSVKNRINKNVSTSTTLEYGTYDDAVNPVATNVQYITGNSDGYGLRVKYNTSGIVDDLSLTISLGDVMPPEARIVSASVRVDTSTADWNGSSSILLISSSGPSLGSDSVNLSAATAAPILLVIPSSELKAENVRVKVFILDAEPTVSASNVAIDALQVVYTW